MENNIHVTLPEEIYHYLKNNIASFKLKPGEKISEAGLARQFGCSRVPVREACSQLVKDKALEIIPQKGGFVTKIDMIQVEQSRYLRQVLESEVVLSAFDKGLLTPIIPYLRSLIQRQERALLLNDYIKVLYLDSEFHYIFFSADNKEFVISHTGNDEIHYLRARLLSLTLEPHGSLMIYQHKQILDAIEANNRGLLQQTLTDHFTNVQSVLNSSSLMNSKYKEYITLN